MGLDSLGSTELAFELGRQIGTDLPETIAYDHPTVFRLISHIVPGEGHATADHVTKPRQRSDTLQPRQDDHSDAKLIAVEGVAFRFSGADGVQAFRGMPHTVLKDGG